MVLPCFPNNKPPTNRHSLMVDNELNAFDLTWRNYLPSVSPFCCCNSRGIRLPEEEEENNDPLIEPPYYNDHTLYRGEALENYLDNPRDWEFESVLGQNETPQFVTRNPFGTKSIKKSKSNKKKKNKRERPVIMEESGDITGYDIEDDDQQEGYYYNNDAEFLGDDQIANLAYNRNSSQMMDQYGEELYYQHVQGPIVQEMQAPPRQFYAARTMPNIYKKEDYDDYEERVINVEAAESSVVKKPKASVEVAQVLLSDLTEKLAFIKNNIIHIQPEVERNSDIDSITSEALNVYENTTNQPQRRYSSGDELHLPSLIDNNTPPFVSDQHPFTYFTDHSILSINEEEESQGLNVRNVFGWLGV